MTSIKTKELGQKMRKSFCTTLSLLALACNFLFASSTLAAGMPNIADGEAIFNDGKGEAAACMGCHGETGLGMDAMGAPRIANIGQGYIVKQLEDFAAERRMPEGMGAAMNGFAAALSQQDRLDVARYLDTLEYVDDFSDLKSIAEEGTTVGNPEKGKMIVTKGIKGKVPACQDCHGFNGRAARFPAINQQKYVYLVTQLNAWRDGSRANDPVVGKRGIMRGIARKLSPADIEDISAYLSTAPRVAPKSLKKRKK